jgi:formamidopyrimidine-DNA glycosylase
MAMELPEMTRIAGQLKHELVGKSFKEILFTDKVKKLSEWGFTNLKQRDITHSKIIDVRSSGHYVFVEMESGYNLIFGDLVGKILYHETKGDVPGKFTLAFMLSDDLVMTFHTNLYGYAIALTQEEIGEHKYIGHGGISPLDKEFTYDYFERMLKANETLKVKKIQSLYDNMIGFQNGYFQDILFCAKISPLRTISDLTPKEKETLFKCLMDITKKAVAENGSSGEVDIYGMPGNYNRIMGNHMKSKPCPRCGAPIIQKNILGSNSYYCVKCQK